MTAALYIVTGASRGLGRAIVAQLLAPGVTVLGLSRTLDPHLDAEARSAGATLEQWPVDLADASPVSDRVRSWLARFDPAQIDEAVLVNNAGTLGRIAPLSQAHASDLTRAMRIGLEAPMLLTAAFVGATAQWRASRKVLNISSGLGRFALPSQASYCASKAGMDHFSRVLALEGALETNGVRVVSLAPGVIDTGMQDTLRSTDPALFPDIGRFEKMKADGALDSPAVAAAKVIRFLSREDFGSAVIADVRDA